MPPEMQELYIYFLKGGKESRQALQRFYMRGDQSREFVRSYAQVGKKFFADFMSIYLEEIKGAKESRGSFV